jgi:hypothetical protein
MGGDPSLDSAPTNSGQDSLILRILKAVETHDYGTLLTYTVDKETDYFGHKNSSSAFIQQDMMQDARFYKWCKFVPDLSTFQTSLGHDSIEYDSDALDVRGKEHKSRCRFDIYYTPTTSPRLQALSLKVLPNHLQSGDSGSTVTGPTSEQDDESGFENAIAKCTEIIKTKVIPQYETKYSPDGKQDGFTVKPLDVVDDPAIAKWIDEYGSIWKQLYPVVADTYAGIQRKVNDRNKPEANKYRALLADVFHQACGLREYGSYPTLSVFASAHEEWIIANFGFTGYSNVPDDEFVSRLTRSRTVEGEAPSPSDVQRVLTKLKEVESFLNQDDAAFLRKEFLAYFER